MNRPLRGRTTPLPASSGPPEPRLIPYLLLRSGTVQLSGEGGPRPLIGPNGTPADPFDVVDRLSGRFPLVYLVDLDAIEHGEPQLEYLQEFARDVALWVDAGTHTADQAIDILVAGASRVVLSSSTLDGPEELARAWALSSQIAFEVEMPDGRLSAVRDWQTDDPMTIARAVRAIGPDHFILSPHGVPTSWELVRELATLGRTWVDGSLAASDIARLDPSGAAGGLIHLAVSELLPESSPLPDPAGPDDNAR